MEAINLIDSFAEFKELKNIDRATLMSIGRYFQKHAYQALRDGREF